MRDPSTPLMDGLGAGLQAGTEGRGGGAGELVDHLCGLVGGWVGCLEWNAAGSSLSRFRRVDDDRLPPHNGPSCHPPISTRSQTHRGRRQQCPKGEEAVAVANLEAGAVGSDAEAAEEEAEDEDVVVVMAVVCGCRALEAEAEEGTVAGIEVAAGVGAAAASRPRVLRPRPGWPTT